MSTFKKLLALTLALAMVLSVSAFAGYKADTYKDAAAIDADCKSAIELMYALEIMKGDTNGNFNPEATITRAEVAKMIYVILNYGKDDLAVNYKGAKIFSDVVAGAWYEGYVNYAATTKLVQGRGNGTFGPNDPVTCAEAAKMLLTAIGYSAADRGYTGANWSYNVLADAAILGLLDGYKFNTNTYAPRQWVAVMVENALSCYTLGIMKPTFGGLLISGIASSTETMGQKYFNVDTYTGYAVATSGVVLEGGKANSGYVKFTTGGSDPKYVSFKGTGLKAADLGQEYKVIYNTVTDAVYSVRNTGTSIVAEDLGENITKELVYGTGAVKADYAIGKNHWEYTVDGTTLAVVDNAKFMTNDNAYNTTVVSAESKDAVVNAMNTIIGNDAKTTNLVKVIDRNDDGVVDYVIETVYEYAKVTKVNSYNYGDYVWLQFPGKSSVKYYVEDSIIGGEDLEAGQYVKVTVDYDSKMYAVEVLEVASDVTVTKIRNDKYTIGGEEYRQAAKGFQSSYSAMVLKADLDIVYDGDLVVYAGEHKTYIKDLDALNDMLCVVTNTSDHYVFNNIGGQNAIKVLTIDGNEEWIRYNDQDEQNMAQFEGNLYVLKIKSNGSAELAAYQTVTNCAVADPIDPIAPGTLKASESKTTFRKDTKSELMYVDTEATFFLYDTDEKEYSIGTVGDLGLGTDSAAEFQGFVNTDDDWTYMVAGLIKGDPSGASAKGKGYALTTSAPYEVYDEDADKTYIKIDVMFPGDEEETTITLAAATLAEAEGLVADELYYYSYVGSKYTLEEVEWTNSYATNAGVTDPDRYGSGHYEIYNVDGTDFTAVLNENVRYDLWTADDDGADILVRVVNWSAAAEDGQREVTGVSFDFVEELDGDVINGKYDGNTKYWSDFSAIFKDVNADYDREYSLLYVTVYVIEDYVSQ